MNDLNCPNCDTPILEWRGNRILHLGTYAHIAIILSDYSVMEVAACKTCVQTFDNKKMKKIFNWVKSVWESEMAGWASKDQIGRMGMLKAKGFHHSNREAHKLTKEIKRKDHQSKIKNAS